MEPQTVEKIDMVTAGIDPGINGAVAIIDDGELIAVHDMPKITVKSGKSAVNAPVLYQILTEHSIDQVVLEQVGGRPGESAPWAFNFGRSFGIIEGVVGALGTPIRYVSPQKWKKAAGIPPKHKDYARTVAQQLYPRIDLRYKKDVDKAEAILIAVFG